MNHYGWKWVPAILLAAAFSLGGAGAASDHTEPDRMAMVNGLDTGAFPDATVDQTDLPVAGPLTEEELRELTVCPGGMPFGVRFLTEGVSVVGFCDVDTQSGKQNPAERAGIRLKDVILKVNGEPVGSAAELTDRIESSGGQPLALVCRRGQKEFEARLTPVRSVSEERFKTGIWVRDSGAGIGTVTFLMPENGSFAGLGHGICDGDTGEPIAIQRGSVSDVTISSVVKGTPGNPGELKGYFNAGKVGSLLGNTPCGVWGIYTDPPETTAEPIPVGLREDVREGDATILCTLADNRTQEYSIRISGINRDADGAKCFTVTVTDPRLLEQTGGIVQGMSGSPILQGGKLIGAVTHVLVNDPTAGYGIFLENMLARMPVATH